MHQEEVGSFGEAFFNRLRDEHAAYLDAFPEPVRHFLVDEDGVEVEISEEQLAEYRELLRGDATADRLCQWLKLVRDRAVDSPPVS